MLERFLDFVFDYGGYIILTSLLVLLLFVFIGFSFTVSTEAECLDLGYREAKVSIGLSRYCVTRIDQSDVVIPLKEARRTPRR